MTELSDDYAERTSVMAQRYLHHALPRLQPHYVTDNFELVKLLVRATDAYYPLMHTSDSFGGLDGRYLLLRDAVEMPPHHLSYAVATHRPRTNVVTAFEKLLTETLA
jgi:hypothetical protein